MRALNILLVEDHKATNDALSKMLTRRGHHVISVGSVRDALASIHRAKFELIISDIGLPDGDGWNLLKELRGLAPRAKAIALTGFGYPADYEKSVDAGFYLHLTKPASMEEIERAIGRLFPDDDPDPSRTTAGQAV